jgi:coproporphyrinogen III oxidase-like Fe-S oxidoreductase
LLSVSDGLRRILKRSLAGTGQIVLQNRLPLLQRKLQGIEELGLYLHIPFCRQICPYCPYNKEIYRSEVAREYVDALKREIDLYSPLVGRKPVTSFYIGGGTPTTLLHSGLGEILEHVFRAFNMQCEIHMESHPNDLSRENLASIASLGVKHLSMGVEALQDRHLEKLRRPYTAQEVKRAVGRAVDTGFDCVNADFIFAIPGQIFEEVEQGGSRLLRSATANKDAAYPRGDLLRSGL